MTLSDETVFSFYNLPINDACSQHFLNRLEQEAQAGLTSMPLFPEWDRAVYTNPLHCSLKARYKALQNSILHNQRARKQAYLNATTENLPQTYTHTTRQNVLVGEREQQSLAREYQDFLGEDVSYPLMTQTLGIQQQFEQEQAQETAQEQQQAQQSTFEIKPYCGNQNWLITRNNIQHEAITDWSRLPEEIRAHSGVLNNDLTQLFSLWVGSDVNAPQIISKMSMVAVRKLMKHASLFRFGVEPENLPLGFDVYRDRDGSLILQYDERNAIEKPGKAIEPFRLEFYTKQARNAWWGDYRQFAAFSSNPTDQQTLWRFMTITPNDASFLAQAKQLKSDLTEETAPSCLQRHDVESILQEPGDRAQCLTIFAKWAEQEGAPEAFIHALFSEQSPLSLSEKNLKSLGQLENTYEGSSRHWLLMASQLYSTFGPEAFVTWKKHVLDQSSNWTELLEKREVDAVTNSIKILSPHSNTSKKIWWQLIEAHAVATNNDFRYSELWPAFHQTFGLMEKHGLFFNQAACMNLLKNTPNFNARVFLHRLHWTLDWLSHQVDGEAAMQALLDNLDKVDWRHNGFYYAAKYEGYPFWSASLELSGFKQTREGAKPGYHLEKKSGNITDPVLHRKRKIAKQATFGLLTYEMLETFLEENQDSALTSDMLQLAVDTVVAIKGEIQMKDLRTLLNAMKESDLIKTLAEIGRDIKEPVIRARFIQGCRMFYQRGQGDQILDFIQYLSKKHALISNHKFMYYFLPKETLRTIKKMMKAQFKKVCDGNLTTSNLAECASLYNKIHDDDKLLYSTWRPSEVEVFTSFERISKSSDPSITKDLILDEFQQKGFSVYNRSRSLSAPEQQLA